MRVAGICRTDIELLHGYMGFAGIPGHEFVGSVERADSPRWIGKRVVGEINSGCGACAACRAGLGRHCPERSVLGILRHDGCMAEYCALPEANLRGVPSEIPDDRAVFVEPLSAACEILAQVSPERNDRAIVLGDGRLGILCAWVLGTVLRDVTLAGRHPGKLALAAWRDVKTESDPGRLVPGADLVVDATGTSEGIEQASRLCRARGTIVLKTTLAEPGRVDLSPVVIDEQTVVGSRCGRFEDGLRLLSAFPSLPLERLISARFPLAQACDALAAAASPEAVKVLLDVGR